MDDIWRASLWTPEVLLYTYLPSFHVSLHCPIPVSPSVFLSGFLVPTVMPSTPPLLLCLQVSDTLPRTSDKRDDKLQWFTWALPGIQEVQTPFICGRQSRVRGKVWETIICYKVSPSNMPYFKVMNCHWHSLICGYWCWRRDITCHTHSNNSISSTWSAVCLWTIPDQSRMSNFPLPMDTIRNIAWANKQASIMSKRP